MLKPQDLESYFSNMNGLTFCQELRCVGRGRESPPQLDQDSPTYIFSRSIAFSEEYLFHCLIGCSFSFLFVYSIIRVLMSDLC